MTDLLDSRQPSQPTWPMQLSGSPPTAWSLGRRRSMILWRINCQANLWSVT